MAVITVLNLASASRSITYSTGQVAVAGGAMCINVDVNLTAFTGGSTPTAQFQVSRLGADGVLYPVYQCAAIPLAGGKVSVTLGLGSVTAAALLNQNVDVGDTFQIDFTTTGAPTAITFSLSVKARTPDAPRQVTTYVGTNVPPAILVTGKYPSSATATGVSAAQTGTVTVGTAALPIIVADAAGLNLNINVSAYTMVSGTFPRFTATLPLCNVIFSRVELDAVSGSQTVDAIANIPVTAQVTDGATGTMPVKVAKTLGLGLEVPVDFGWGIIVQVVLANNIASLTYSWSLMGKN